MGGLCGYQAKGSSLLTERVWMALFFPFMQAHSAAPVSRTLLLPLLGAASWLRQAPPTLTQPSSKVTHQPL